MVCRIALLSAALVACVTSTVLAQSQQGTPQEREACAPDVRKFCKSANDETMRVLACLQANRGKISAACNNVLVSHGQ
jgi:Cysteine rich repeat